LAHLGGDQRPRKEHEEQNQQIQQGTPSEAE